MKIFVQSKDTAFVERLRLVHADVELVDEGASIEQIDKGLSRGDLLFLAQVSAQSFYDSKAYVVVVAAVDSRSEELLAARRGAKGYVSSDIPEPLLVNMINCVAAGEIWMTRETIAKVFEEYAKLMS